MRTTGPRAFWLSFLITLGVVLPLMGSFALSAVRQRDQAAPAQQPQSGVPIRTPGPRHCWNLLAVSAGERPAFVLLRLDAQQNLLVVEAVPGESVLLGQSGPALLADSYASAGPARAAALLGETLGVPIDRYLAATPETLCAALAELGSVRLDLTGLLREEEQAGLGLAGPVQEYDPEAAAAFLAGQEAALAPERLGALRAALWEAFARQKLQQLPAALPDGLRRVSSRLLTNLTAEDLYTLAQILNFLAGAGQTLSGQAAEELQPDDPLALAGGLRIVSGVLPGRWDPRTGRYEFGEETAALAAQLFAAGSRAEDAAPPSPESPDGADPDPAEDAAENFAADPQSEPETTQAGRGAGSPSPENGTEKPDREPAAPPSPAPTPEPEQTSAGPAPEGTPEPGQTSAGPAPEGTPEPEQTPAGPAPEDTPEPGPTGAAA